MKFNVYNYPAGDLVRTIECEDDGVSVLNTMISAELVRESDIEDEETDTEDIVVGHDGGWYIYDVIGTLMWSLEAQDHDCACSQS